jgi:hypothetical protein
MKTSSNAEENPGHRGSRGLKPALLGLIALLLVSSFAAGAARASSYNDVQVFVTTSAQHPYSYTFTAYNSSGSQVATYQGGYPAGAFELPSGEYLFTVSALNDQGVVCPCAYPVTAGGPSTTASSGQTATGLALLYNGTGTQTNSTGSGNSTTTISPIFKTYEPESEYGYAVVDVSSTQTVYINTINVTQFPTYQVMVKVAFLNGTAVAGASVSGSVIGQWYYWWGEGSNVTTSAQTGADGTAVLTLPKAPLLITAWDWISHDLPANQSATVNVGGQKINVTETWGPAYIGLSGSANLIPPADSVNITLQYQQPDYWEVPGTAQTAAGSSGSTPTGTVASAPSGVPTQVIQTTTAESAQDKYYQPVQIGALVASGGLTVTGSGPLGDSATLVAAAVAVVVLAVLAAVVLARRQRPPAPQA